MIGCLWTHVQCVLKQSIVALYFEFWNELKFYDHKARFCIIHAMKRLSGKGFEGSLACALPEASCCILKQDASSSS